MAGLSIGDGKVVNLSSTHRARGMHPREGAEALRDADVLVIAKSAERRQELARIAERAGARPRSVSPESTLEHPCVGAIGWGDTSQIQKLARMTVPRAWLVEKPRGLDVNRAAAAGVTLVALLPDGFGLVERFVRHALGTKCGSHDVDTVPDLTTRQAEVLQAIMRGLHRSAILDELSITESTLEKHLSAIYRVTREYSIAAVYAWALKRRLQGSTQPR